jgi:hypothetical protein
MKKEKKVMKTILIGALLMALYPLSMHAQGSKAGIKGGLNLSTLSVEDANDNNMVPGFHLGVWGKVMLSDAVGIQPEMLFSSKGVKTIYDEEFLGFDVADGETKLKLNYIDIPIYLVYNLSDDFNFHLGPYFGILMNASMETDTEILGFIDIDDEEEIDREEFNAVDIGISAGLGFELDPIVLGFNYNLGLQQVAKEGEATEELLGDAKNNVIQIYIGFNF